jgi:hypothetical protein
MSPHVSSAPRRLTRAFSGLGLYIVALLYANLTLLGSYLAFPVWFWFELDIRLACLMSLAVSGLAVLFTPSALRGMIWELAGSLRVFLIFSSPVYLLGVLALGWLAS